MKKQLSAKPLLFPMPTPLIAAEHEGEGGLLTVAWIGMASGTPPTIGMAVRASRNTLRLIEASAFSTASRRSSGMPGTRADEGAVPHAVSGPHGQAAVSLTSAP